MAKNSVKNPLSPSVVLILLVIAVVATYFVTSLKYASVIFPNGTLTNACKANGKGNLEEILKMYTVKKGDSLLSISKNELGDPSRYQEIAIMNGDKYPGLFSSPGVVSKNAFLEIGWNLLLPPNWIKISSGQLDIINGMIFDQDQDGIKITTNSDKSGWDATLKFDKNTVNSQNSIFKVGNCITAVRDVRLNRVLKLDLQAK